MSKIQNQIKLFYDVRNQDSSYPCVNVVTGSGHKRASEEFPGGLGVGIPGFHYWVPGFTPWSGPEIPRAVWCGQKNSGVRVMFYLFWVRLHRNVTGM